MVANRIKENTLSFDELDAWLRKLRVYLTANRDFALQRIAAEMPALRATAPEASYLLWLDCAASNLEQPYRAFLERGKVALNDGAAFGQGYARFVRLNFGCPRAQLADALERMCAALR